MRLEGWHLIFIIVLALVLFATPKLPGIARSLGQSIRIFKSEVHEMKKEGTIETETDPISGRVVNHPKNAGTGATPRNGTDVPPPRTSKIRRREP